MKWLAALGLALIVAPASAEAAVESFSTGLGAAMSFAAFDPSLGSLNTATLKLNLSVFDAFFADNTTGGPQAFTLSDPVFATITAPDGGTYLDDAGTPAVDLVAAGPFDMFDIRSNVVFTNVDAHPLLASFSSAATGNVTYSANIAAEFGPEHVPGVQYLPLSHLIEGTATLTYDYSPALSAVPEPSNWALIVVGFGALGAGLRRGRRVIANQLTAARAASANRSTRARRSL